MIFLFPFPPTSMSGQRSAWVEEEVDNDPGDGGMKGEATVDGEYLTPTAAAFEPPASPTRTKKKGKIDKIRK